MKTISVIYRNRGNYPAIESLKANLEFIFENYVRIENVYLDDLDDNEIIESDIFLIVMEPMINLLKKHILDLDFDKVVVMTRGIEKKYISEIQKIPSDTDVLVVDDSYESTIQVIYELYRLGISNANLIAYDKKNHDNYKDISIAITPNEEPLVPEFIKNVINIGYRKIGYDTFVKIMGIGHINQKLISRNLIAYMDNIIEPNSSFRSNFLNSYLKSELLDKFIFNSKDAILLLDSNYNLVYSNNKFNKIFNIDTDRSEAVTKNNSSIGNKIYDLMEGGDFDGKLIEIGGENYTEEKDTLRLIDQVIGYSIILRHEKDIRDLELSLKNNLIKKGLYAKYTFNDIIHKSDVMNKCIAVAKKAALTDYNILIEGESGTGKELIAQSIHNFSGRKNMPFVAINCGALPETLLESELFGYEKGSFTGANKSGKLGLFEQANTGTIFLDEIGDISNNLQRQLLRVIQERQIMRIGGNRLISIDVRIIVATNKNLKDEISRGNFRNDLYFRLNVIPVNVPPLKNRKEDILILLQNFLESKYSDLSKIEKQNLLNYNWPGNVRELESVSKYYKTLGEFPPHIIQNQNKVYKNDRTYISDSILKTISENTGYNHGIGRTKLLFELKKTGIAISDPEARKLLEALKAGGYIEINQGRSGCRITDKGAKYLNGKN